MKSWVFPELAQFVRMGFINEGCVEMGDADTLCAGERRLI